MNNLHHRDTETQRKAKAVCGLAFLCVSVSLWWLVLEAI